MNKCKKPQIKIEGIEITDKNIKYVLLDSGTYEIDGEIIEVEGGYYDKKSVGVKSFDNIKIVSQNTYIEKYTNGEIYKSVEEYETEKLNLLTKRKYLYEDEYEWESLEDEYAYRKFIQVWQPIKKTIQEISKPIVVGVKTTKYETGNKYIESCFLNGINKDFNLFIYDRPRAVLDMVSECFTELGMIFEENKDYNVTGGKKIWSNSTHSCIRYVVAFGTYIFDDGWDIRNSPKGTLEDMTSKYESDRKTLRSIIINKYNKHFGKIDQGIFDFDELLKKLNFASNLLDKVDSKQKTYDEYRSGINNLREAIEIINNSYSVNVEI